jgi:acid phosphatase family membrane protein YuiD
LLFLLLFDLESVKQTWSACMQVMYDASGVRLHAGKQASVLNMIITELPPDHPVSNSAGMLKDTLGHTPLQVAVGAVVGVLTGYLVALLYL